MNESQHTATPVTVYQKGRDSVQWVACSASVPISTSIPMTGASGFNIPNGANVAAGKEIIVEAIQMWSPITSAVTWKVGTTASGAKVIWLGTVSGGAAPTNVPMPIGGIRARVDGGILRYTTTVAGVRYYVSGHTMQYEATEARE